MARQSAKCPDRDFLRGPQPDREPLPAGDWYPQRPGQPEDSLAAESVRKGFQRERLVVEEEESASARRLFTAAAMPRMAEKIAGSLNMLSKTKARPEPLPDERAALPNFFDERVTTKFPAKRDQWWADLSALNSPLPTEIFNSGKKATIVKEIGRFPVPLVRISWYFKKLLANSAQNRPSDWATAFHGVLSSEGPAADHQQIWSVAAFLYQQGLICRQTWLDLLVRMLDPPDQKKSDQRFFEPVTSETLRVSGTQLALQHFDSFAAEMAKSLTHTAALVVVCSKVLDQPSLRIGHARYSALLVQVLSLADTLLLDADTLTSILALAPRLTASTLDGAHSPLSRLTPPSQSAGPAQLLLPIPSLEPPANESLPLSSTGDDAAQALMELRVVQTARAYHGWATPCCGAGLIGMVQALDAWLLTPQPLTGLAASGNIAATLHTACFGANPSVVLDDQLQALCLWAVGSPTLASSRALLVAAILTQHCLLGPSHRQAVSQCLRGLLMSFQNHGTLHSDAVLLRLCLLVRQCIEFDIFSHDEYARSLLCEVDATVQRRQLPLLARLPVMWNSRHEMNQRRLALYGFGADGLARQAAETEEAVAWCRIVARAMMASAVDDITEPQAQPTTPAPGRDRLAAVAGCLRRALTQAAADMELDPTSFAIPESDMELAGSAPALPSPPTNGIAATLCPAWLLSVTQAHAASDGVVGVQLFSLIVSVFGMLHAPFEALQFTAGILTSFSASQGPLALAIASFLSSHAPILGFVPDCLPATLQWISASKSSPLVFLRHEIQAKYSEAASARVEFDARTRELERAMASTRSRRATRATFGAVLEDPAATERDDFEINVSDFDAAARFVSGACLSAAGFELKTLQCDRSELGSARFIIREEDGESSVVLNSAPNTANGRVNDKVLQFADLVEPEDILRALSRNPPPQGTVTLVRVVEGTHLDAMTEDEIEKRAQQLGELLAIAVRASQTESSAGPDPPLLATILKCLASSACRRIGSGSLTEPRPNDESLQRAVVCLSALCAFLVRSGLCRFADLATHVLARTTKRVCTTSTDGEPAPAQRAAFLFAMNFCDQTIARICPSGPAERSLWSALPTSEIAKLALDISILRRRIQIPKRLLIAVVWGCVGDAPALLPLLGEDFTATAEVREALHSIFLSLVERPPSDLLETTPIVARSKDRASAVVDEVFGHLGPATLRIATALLRLLFLEWRSSSETVLTLISEAAVRFPFVQPREPQFVCTAAAAASVLAAVLRGTDDNIAGRVLLRLSKTISEGPWWTKPTSSVFTVDHHPSDVRGPATTDAAITRTAAACLQALDPREGPLLLLSVTTHLVEAIQAFSQRPDGPTHGGPEADMITETLTTRFRLVAVVAAHLKLDGPRVLELAMAMIRVFRRASLWQTLQWTNALHAALDAIGTLLRKADAGPGESVTALAEEVSLLPSFARARFESLLPRNVLANVESILCSKQEGSIALRKRGDPGLTWFGVSKMKRTTYRTRIERAFIDSADPNLL